MIEELVDCLLWGPEVHFFPKETFEYMKSHICKPCKRARRLVRSLKRSQMVQETRTTGRDLLSSLPLETPTDGRHWLKHRRKKSTIVDWTLKEGLSEQVTFQSNPEWKKERREDAPGRWGLEVQGP